MTSAEKHLAEVVEEIIHTLKTAGEYPQASRLGEALDEWEGDRSHLFARVCWNAEDIQGLRPNWHRDECEEFLSQEESTIQDGMVERGWDIIGDLLASLGSEAEGQAPEEYQGEKQ